MVELDEYFNNLEPIDISSLLKEIDLPVRLVNLLKEKKFYSVENFYNTVDKLTLAHTSQFLFPNRLVSFYPQVRERHASCDLVCNLSGAKIKQGSLYYTYHPFIEDLKSGKVYTIKKKIKAELAYIDCFPQDLITYEEWYYKVKNAYYTKDDNSIVDFYSLSVECGEDCLEPYLLGKSKLRKK